MEAIIFYWKKVLSWLFPARCLGCGRFEEAICRNCLKEIRSVNDFQCPYCRTTVLKDGKVCSQCRCSGKPLKAVFYCSEYGKNKLLTRALWKFKFKAFLDYGFVLAKIMDRKLEKIRERLGDNWLACDIPASEKRIKKFGFNQVELISNSMYELMGRKRLLLQRKDGNREQKTLDLAGRQENIRNKLFCNQKLNGENILIIDDVATTLATLDEAARVLKEAGAGKIYGLVLLRQRLRANR